MVAIVYTEDAFLTLYDQIYSGYLVIDNRDHSAVLSFYKIIQDGELLTENQAKFIVRLLKKYNTVFENLPDTFKEVVDFPRWRREFRKIDFTKEVFVEIENNTPWVCLKFPYILKETFEKEILNDTDSFLYSFRTDQYWDKERKLRKLNLYSYNILQIYEFVEKNSFRIDDSFIEAVNLVEDIWNDEENIVKKSKIVDGNVVLNNADEYSIKFFEKNQKNFESNLLLAKSMGFVLDQHPRTVIDKIAASDESWFWHKDIESLLDVLSIIDGKIVFLLDRSSDYKTWLQKFKDLIENINEKHKVRICFRLSNNEDSNFNAWIKENGFGGKADEGKFLIFLQKPNKWLFNQINDVKVIVTNSIYPPNDQIAMYFLQSHPCVIFAGDVKPTDPKGRKIVSL